MPRKSKKQQTYEATEAILLLTCKLHEEAAAALRDIAPTHGNGDAYDALSALVDRLSTHVEEVGSHASVVDLGLTKVVIAHFKHMATVAAEDAMPAVATVALPSPDVQDEVPEFDLTDSPEGENGEGLGDD
jgi:hypothetical protein